MSSSSSSTFSCSSFLSQLSPSSPPSDLLSLLHELKHRHLKSSSKSSALLNGGLVDKLVLLLERPNSRIVDVTLSVLANLMLEPGPRKMIRRRGLRGLPILVGILSTLGEESILGRGARAVANLAQDSKNATLLHNEDIIPVLVKILGDVESDKTKQIIVRAIRILSGAPAHKRHSVEAQAVSAVARQLPSEDEDLLRATAKCLAHFTNGCGPEVAAQIQGEDGRGFERLVGLVRHQKRTVWEAAVACLVNLSHLGSLRPSLGNAGTVAVLVDKMLNTEDLSAKEVAHTVTALCLYCRESVNRMKLRELGGLKLFVKILDDERRESLHDRILNSLLQYGYDDLSLKVLQREGLIPCLIKFIEAYTKENYLQHDCAEEICGDDVSFSVCDTSLKSALGEEEESNEAKEENTTEEGRAEASAAEAAEPEREKSVPAVPEDEDMEEEQESKGEKSKERETRFRVNSPSYQAVQHEFEEMMRIRSSKTWVSESPHNSLCQSPDRSPFAWSSPGYSPNYSSPSASSFGSPSGSSSRYSSPYRSPSPDSDFSGSLPQYSPSHYGDHLFSSSENGDEDLELANVDAKSEVSGEAAYSPVERFSDDEPEEPQPSTSSAAPQTQLSSSPPRKKLRANPPAKLVLPSQSGYKSIFSPSYESSFNDFSPAAAIFNAITPMSPPAKGTSGGTSASKDESAKENSKIGWVLMILSRLSQAERPHEDMSKIETTKALIAYLSNVKSPLTRAGRILLRLSKNLYCVMPYVNQRHLLWISLALESRPTLPDSKCKSCTNLYLLRSSLMENLSLLAETGYAEGQMCHTLMRGMNSERKNVAMSTPMMVRPRRLLRNILLAHEGLEILLDILESEEPEEDKEMFSHTVYSIYTLASHLGVVAISLTLEAKDSGNCHYKEDEKPSDETVELKLDDGESLLANRKKISEASEIFQAMLSGGFAESSQSSIRLPLTSREALSVILHYLYGCRWCPAFQGLDVAILLELVALTDKYMLTELNKSVSHEIVQRCLCAGQVVAVYESALQNEYPVHGSDQNLSACAVNYLLVGAMPSETRVEVFKAIMGSRLKADFADDVGKVLRKKMGES